MGWTPADVRASSLSDFTAALNGYLIANGASEPGLSSEKRKQLLDLLD